MAAAVTSTLSSSSSPVSSSSILTLAKKDESLQQRVCHMDDIQGVNEYDEDGSALHASIKRGNESNVRWLLEHGALTHLTNHQFQSPLTLLFQHASRELADRVLSGTIEKQSATTMEDIEWAMKLCLQCFAGDGSSSDVRLLDYCVSRLLGVDLSHQREKYGAESRMTYFGMINKLEVPRGWITSEFLPMRIRSIFEILVHLRDPAAPGIIPKSMPIAVDEIRRLLNDELQVEITSCFYSIAWKSCNTSAYHLSCIKNIIHRLSAFSVGSELSLPAGWAGHAIYISFIRVEQEKVVIRVDNVGEGSTLTYQSSHPFAGRMIHCRTKNQCSPAIIGVSDIPPLNDPTFDKHPLVDYLGRVIKAIAESSPVSAELLGDVYNQRGQFFPSEYQADELTASCASALQQQTASCVLDSHNVGMYVRFSRGLKALLLPASFHEARTTFLNWFHDRESDIAGRKIAHEASLDSTSKKVWFNIGKDQARLDGDSPWLSRLKDLASLPLDLPNEKITIHNLQEISQHFIPRRSLYHQLRQYLDSWATMSEKPLILVEGDSGSGKSEFLRHFARSELHRLRKQDQEKAIVFWLLDATSVESVQQGLQSLLDRLKILESCSSLNPERLLSILQDEFNQTNSKVVFIFDNVLNFKLIQPYVPRWAQVLIGSSNDVSDADFRISLRDGFTYDEANQMLTNITGLEAVDDLERRELVEFLHYMPSSVVVAASDIRSLRMGEGSPNYRSSDYLKREHEKLRSAVQRLLVDGNADCRGVLIVASFLHRQSIPLILLQQVYCNPSGQCKVTHSVDCTHKFQQLLDDNRSILYINATQSALSIHPVAQEQVLTSSENQPIAGLHNSADFRSYHLAKPFAVIKKLYGPSTKYPHLDYALMESIMPHLDEMLKHCGSYNRGSDLLLNMLCLQGTIKSKLACYSEAIHLFKQASDMVPDLGNSLPSQLSSCGSMKLVCLSGIGEAYWKLHEIEQAKEYLTEAISINPSDINDEVRLLQAEAKSLLGNVLKEPECKEYILARKYHQEALDMYEKNKHPAAIQSHNEIGVVLRQQNQREDPELHRETLKYFETALEKARERFPENRAITAPILGNIGAILHDMKKTQEALKPLQEAVAIYQEVYTNPDRYSSLSTCLTTIGSCYRIQNEWSKALPYFDDAFRLRLKTFGTGNKTTRIAFSLLDRGSAYEGLHRFSEALKDYTAALEQLQVMYGSAAEDNTFVAFLKMSIGRVHLEMSELDSAEMYFDQAQEMYSRLKRQDRLDECAKLLEKLNLKQLQASR